MNRNSPEETVALQTFLSEDPAPYAYQLQKAAPDSARIRSPSGPQKSHRYHNMDTSAINQSDLLQSPHHSYYIRVRCV